ncbi:MAG: choice-of-anchor D domain-containing protein, partial [Kiritimatiellae bacterium]|nr:choice-of-anchor D domain-containing protein [Kiritimatiellia bacterium]
MMRNSTRRNMGFRGWWLMALAAVGLAWTPEARAQTTLLLRAEGSFGSTTITDSTGRHSPVRVGDAQIVSLNSLSGASQARFSTGNYLTVAPTNDLAFGTNDFTIEFILNLTNDYAGSSDDWVVPLAVYESTAKRWIVGLNASGGPGAALNTLRLSGAGIAINCEIAFNPNPNTNYHIAIQRRAGAVSFFVNGTTQTLTSASGQTADFNMTINNVVIGSGYYNGVSAQYVRGLMSRFRISKGIGRYASSFDPAAIDYTPDEYTRLLLNFDGSVADSSGTGKTITNTGVLLGTAMPSGVAGSGALRLDGAGDGVTAADSPDWDFGTGDFTVHAWAKVLAYPSIGDRAFLVEHHQGSQGQDAGAWYWALWNVSGTNSLAFAGGAWPWPTKTVGITLPSNTWTHLAVVRSAGYLSFYKDGQLQGSPTTFTENLTNSYTHVLTVGASYNDGGLNYSFFNGYLDNVTVVKGQALWTTNFVPPGDPEIAVSGNGLNIADGDTTPSVTDHTDFGSVDVSGGAPVTRTFTVTNSGLSELTLGSVVTSGTHKTDFVVTSQPAPSLAAGGSTTFQVRFAPGGGGLRSATLSLSSNDGDENPFDFAVQGRGAVPEIAVSGNGVSIADGDTTPSGSDWTDFGTISADTGTLTRTFTITNSGDAALSVGTVSVTGAFSVASQPAASVAAGGSTSFEIAFTPRANGAHGATVSFTNGDSDESPFNFAVQGVGLRALDNCVLFMAGDGTFGSTTIPDLTGRHTLTANGNAQIVTYNTEYECSQAYFNGSSAYLSVPDSDDWNFGTNNFTIEFVMNMTQAPGANVAYTMCSQYESLGNQRASQFSYRDVSGTKRLVFFYSTDGNSGGSVKSVYSDTVISSGTNHHIAIVREGSTARLYVDGVAVPVTGGFGSDTIFNSSSTYEIGRVTPSAPVQYFPGYIARFRLSKGVARYSTDFDPHVVSFVADSYTKLLLHFDGNVNDSSGTGKTVTNNGVVPGTALPAGMAGGGALYLDGSGDYLTIPDSDDFFFGTNDWTLDLWWKPTRLGAWQWFLKQLSPDRTGTCSFYMKSDNRMAMVFQQNEITYGNYFTTAAAPLTTGAWHHIAFARSGTNGYLFVDGQVVPTTASIPFGSSSLPNINNMISLGAANNPVEEFLYGYLKNYRIVKGQALWTANFAPPDVPDIDVRGNGVWIADGDTTPSETDHTDFGYVPLSGGTPVTRTFTVTNGGYGTLTLGTVTTSGTHAADFVVVAQPASSVSEGGTTTFQVQFTPGAAGNRTATLSLSNNDNSENPYDFTVQGQGAVPEIAVLGNGVSIADGDTTPSGSDWTDFGTISADTGTLTRTFTITNSGDAALSVGTVSVTGAFSVASQPAASVAAGGSTTFQIAFTPRANGTHGAAVSFTNGDSDESPFNFAVQGVGLQALENCVLFVAGDGTFGSTTIPDLTGRHTMTAAGNAQIAALDPASGLTIADFNGTSSYLALGDNADWAFGTNDFTIEAEVFVDVLSEASGGKVPSIFIQSPDINNRTRLLINWSGTRWGLHFDCASGGSTLVNLFGTTSVGGVLSNSWHTLAVSRRGTNTQIFIDGVVDGQATGSYSVPDFAATPWIGRMVSGVSYWFDGKIRRYRISKGIGRYMGNYDAAAVDWSADGYTKFLLNTDGLISDASGTGKAVTNAGVVAGTALPEGLGGNGAVFFDGSGDYLFTPDSADWAFGGGDFTWSMWVKWTSRANYPGSWGQRNGSTYMMWQAAISTGSLWRFSAFNAGSPVASYDMAWTPETNTWYHLALVRSSSRVSMFVNGVARPLTTNTSIGSSSLPDVSANFEIGGENGAWNFFPGYIRNFAVVKGRALWTNDFAPPGVPDLDVYGNDVKIADGDATPSLADHTDFGPVAMVGGTPVTRTFTITNGGYGTLTLGTVTTSGAHAADFMVVSQPASSVAAGEWTTFQVRFTPSASGNRTAALSLSNNDNDENPYNFSIQGQGAVPEIAVLGNGVSIADGDTAPTNTDHTDFGIVSADTGTLVRTFTITNSGDAALSVGTVSVTGSFSVASQPAASVAAGGTTTFQITFTPRANGTHGATVSFTNGDGDESPFDFAVQGVGLQALDHCVLFVAGDGESGSTNIPDLTGRHTLTANGNTKIIASGVFGSAAYFNGTSSYLAMPDSEDWNFGSGDFTVDFWAKGTPSYVVQLGDVGGSPLISYGAAGSLYLSTDGVNWDIASDVSMGGTSVEWAHYAVARSGNNFYTFKNGVLISSFSSSSTIWRPNGEIRIGRAGSGYHNGWIDELRISKGIARWTSNFTPPTSAHTTDAYTKLLLHFDGNVNDSSGTGKTVTNNGVVPGTALPEGLSGNGAVYVDGNGDYLTTPDSADWALGSGDFTFQWWYKPATPSGTHGGFFNQYAANNGFGMYHLNFNKIRFYSDPGGVTVALYERSWTPVLNQWYHMALVRQGTNLLLFIDGTRQTWTSIGTALSPGATLPDNSSAFEIGCARDSGGRYYAAGYLKNFMVAKGRALWTSDFAPPDAPDIDMYGNGVKIADGDATPSLADHTDFGPVAMVGGTPVTRTFTVTNSGYGTLTLGTVTTSGTHAADFVVTSQPASSLAAGATTTFQVQFTPSA